MTKAAGILFVSLDGNALFLRRTMTAPDCPGCWDLPGGAAEGEETAEEAAIRETREEIGFLPDGERKLHTKTSSAPKGVAGIGAPPVLPVPAGAPTAPPADVANPSGVSATPGPAAFMPPDVDFTTYLQKVTNEFTPELNDEHDGWAWAPVSAPPEPLHPGCRIALDRISMDELGVARAIADGRLASPQRYENVWLFAIRVTGTRFAYRDKIDEYVVRKPENYLTDEFLARCNGLPVIFKHPKKALLDSDEFSNRVVGTVFLPYIAGDEVWAVAKIFVDDVAQMMKEGDLSTSPGVNFADFTVNARLTLEDGAKVLVEGKPSLLDHVAICELGVWDKGGDPAGIRSESREDSAMAEDEDKAKKDAAEEAERKAKKDAAKKDAAEKEEKEKADKAKADADAGTTLDKGLKHMLDGIADSVKSMKDAVMGIGKRMDAIEDIEKKRGDAAKKDDEPDKDKEATKEPVADKAKKDAAKKDDDEKDKEDKAKADSARVSPADLDKRFDDLARMIPKDMNDTDYHALVDAQSRADDVFTAFGQRAPRPQQGENVAIYERRCVRLLKQHSPTWKAAEVTNAFADDASFGIVRDQVYREARATALNPVNVKPGELRMIERKRDGHIIREFVGEPRTWMNPLAGPVQMRAEGAFKTGSLGRTN
jgi:8-oxo-dGTP pyrophosphatase MutT (NUDIX family)